MSMGQSVSALLFCGNADRPFVSMELVSQRDMHNVSTVIFRNALDFQERAARRSRCWGIGRLLTMRNACQTNAGTSRTKVVRAVSREAANGRAAVSTIADQKSRLP
jgi:hypothetical protein